MSLLNSVASVAYSSEPRIWILWLYSPSRTRRMEVRIRRIRPEPVMEKTTAHKNRMPISTSEPRKIVRSRLAMMPPCEASYSIIYTQPTTVSCVRMGAAA